MNGAYIRLCPSSCSSDRCLQGYPYKCPKLQIVPEKGLSKTDADNLLSLLYDQVYIYWSPYIQNDTICDSYKWSQFPMAVARSLSCLPFVLEKILAIWNL